MVVNHLIRSELATSSPGEVAQPKAQTLMPKGRRPTFSTVLT